MKSARKLAHAFCFDRDLCNDREGGRWLHSSACDELTELIQQARAEGRVEGARWMRDAALTELRDERDSYDRDLAGERGALNDAIVEVRHIDPERARTEAAPRKDGGKVTT